MPSRRLLLSLLAVPVAGAVAYQVACQPRGEVFTPALAGYTFAFPRDHAAHPGYKTEWWYYTGHLRGPKPEQRYGYQLTLFRVRLTPEEQARPLVSHFAADQVFFGHFAVTDLAAKRFVYSELISRGSLGEAGARTDYYRTFLDPWTVQQLGNQFTLDAADASDSTSLRLILGPGKGVIVNGVDGVSMKGSAPGQASHYYSMPRMPSAGVLTVDGQPVQVVGESWMDHEFGSNQLSPDQVGWDWFSLQLSDGSELMLYRLRRQDGSTEPASSGTFIDPTGHARHLTLAEYRIDELARWTSPVSKATYPARWRVQVPGLALDLTITPTLADQELRTRNSTRVVYWEGDSNVTGTSAGKPVTGQGYVELTGYAGSMAGSL